MTHGFALYKTVLIMKFDLSQEIKDFPVAPNVVIKQSDLENEEEIKKYFIASKLSQNGNCLNLASVRRTKHFPGCALFNAYSADELIGSVMTYSVTEERSATENIFVVPSWRRKGIAKACIITALKHLKAQGQKEASLTVRQDNKGAINLYLSLGYRMLDTMYEFSIEVELKK